MATKAAEKLEQATLKKGKKKVKEREKGESSKTGAAQ
jgi:hypothetical protein